MLEFWPLVKSRIYICPSYWQALLLTNNGSTIANQPSGPRRKFKHSQYNSVVKAMENWVEEM
jgi:hypothetical protein